MRVIIDRSAVKTLRVRKCYPGALLPDPVEFISNYIIIRKQIWFWAARHIIPVSFGRMVVPHMR
jgi:hypothetical protein